jgi:hypothetical protein
MGELEMREYEIDGSEVNIEIGSVYRTLTKAKLIRHSVDTIAYTEDFERLYQRISKYHPLTRNEVFTRLMNQRKVGRAHAPNGRRKKQHQGV